LYFQLSTCFVSFRIFKSKELGYPTSLTFAPDRCWLAVDTSRGFVVLFDLRFNVMCRMWGHSSGEPVHRLASCKGLAGAEDRRERDVRETLPPTDGA
jgi:hypothetical protein